ncbi:MAG: DUF167 domain-containing protein [Planctomycetota bacterium]
MNSSAYYTAKEGVYLLVKIHPQAAKEQIQTFHGDRLKISVGAAPEKGKANAALIQLLSKELGLSKQDIQIVSGATTPLKKILLQHYSIKDLEQFFKTKKLL